MNGNHSKKKSKKEPTKNKLFNPNTSKTHHKTEDIGDHPKRESMKKNESL